MEIEIVKIPPADKNGNLLLTNWTNNHKLDEYVDNGGIDKCEKCG